MLWFFPVDRLGIITVHLPKEDQPFLFWVFFPPQHINDQRSDFFPTSLSNSFVNVDHVDVEQKEKRLFDHQPETKYE